MTKLLVKLFVKDYENIEKPSVRSAYGTMAGFVGVFCNVLLFVAKLVIGALSGSVSITADAINNLSDASSSVVTLVGFYLSKKPPDEEHPFGHARIEYLSGLAVAAMILIIGFQLLKTSVNKILNPTVVSFSLVIGVVLVLSIAVKLWMAVFNRNIGKRISSLSLIATATDSRNDVISTSAVLVAALVSHFANLNLDGYIGVIVALFIFYSGIEIAKETIKPLLGAQADEELVKMVKDEMLGYDERILGIHDLMVHDYGPGQRFASVHAEIDYKLDVLESHDMLDNIERMFSQKHNIKMVIHYDPIVTDDEELNEMKELVSKKLKNLNDKISVHDFRMVRGIEHTNLIFDMVIPKELEKKKGEIKEYLDQTLQRVNMKYYTIITFDTESFNKM
ncbi:MAG: cation transporter [Clostridiales bacterium]|nr:cation transporter [Clostridiales bacterium]